MDASPSTRTGASRKRPSGWWLYAVATRRSPSGENCTPPTLLSTSIQRWTLPVDRFSRPMRLAGRSPSSTAAVFIPGATSSQAQSVFSYRSVPASYRLHSRAFTASPPGFWTSLVV